MQGCNYLDPYPCVYKYFLDDYEYDIEDTETLTDLNTLLLDMIAELNYGEVSIYETFVMS